MVILISTLPLISFGEKLYSTSSIVDAKAKICLVFVHMCVCLREGRGRTLLTDHLLTTSLRSDIRSHSAMYRWFCRSTINGLVCCVKRWPIVRSLAINLTFSPIFLLAPSLSLSPHCPPRSFYLPLHLPFYLQLYQSIKGPAILRPHFTQSWKIQYKVNWRKYINNIEVNKLHEVGSR